jgi:hypothetical protein
MTRETIQKSPRGRPTRTPVGKRQRLSVKGKDPAFEYRFVNDTDARVEDFLDAGWTFEDSKTVRIGDKRIEGVSPEGTKLQLSVGSGTKAFLMKIPKEFYIEDQITKQEEVNALEGSMKRELARAGYEGKLDLSRD